MLTQFNQKRRWRRLHKLYGRDDKFNRAISELIRYNLAERGWTQPDWKYYSDSPINLNDARRRYGSGGEA